MLMCDRCPAVLHVTTTEICFIILPGQVETQAQGLTAAVTKIEHVENDTLHLSL